jgi:hypothetical protein
MAIESFPPVATGSNASVQPVGSTGTYNLAVPLTPGLYKITTDTTQSFSTAQLYFATSEGFRFGAVVRGGQGYVAVPQTVTTVTFASGTFPLLIGFEKFDSYQLIQAPIQLPLISIRYRQFVLVEVFPCQQPQQTTLQELGRQI